MPRTTIGPVSTSRAGVDISAAAVPANYDTVNKIQIAGNDGRMHLLLRTLTNADTFVITATALAVDGLTAPTKSIGPVAAGKEFLAGPFPVAVYGSTILVDAGFATSTVIPVNVASS